MIELLVILLAIHFLRRELGCLLFLIAVLWWFGS